MNVTDKYKGAIASITADLELALTSTKKFSVDNLIECKTERLLNDINLLSELDFDIRHGRIKIERLNGYK